MTTPQKPSGPDDPPLIVLHEQRDRVGVERVACGIVRFRRRIVTDTQRIEVVVRREVLEFDPPLGPAATGADEVYDVEADVAADGPEDPSGRTLVVDLHAEVPVVSVQLRPVERVRVGVRRVQATDQVPVTVAREQVQVDVWATDR